MKKTAIIVLTYNNLQYTKDCIESIKKYTPEGTYEIIIVDNNSTDGTREWLKDLDDIKLILNEKNLGFVEGCNQGIALSESDSDILLLNNDTIVTANWLDNLKTCLYSADDIGAAGAVSKSNDNLQGLPLEFKDFDEMQALAAQNNVSDPSRWEQKIFLIGFCFLIKREAFQKVGPLDPAYSPGYVEDNDYSLRLVKAGYRLMLCHDCYIFHYLGTEFRKDLSALMPILYKNRRVFFEKWGFEVFAFDKVRFGALHIFNPPADRPLNILELNCDIGVNLLKIGHKAKNARLFGIEPDSRKADIARYVAEVISGPIEQGLAKMSENFFDYIFIGEALDRHPDPARILALVLRALKSGGEVIGEQKNAMHYQNIKRLITGNAHTPGKPVKSFTPIDITNLFTSCGFFEPYVFHWYSVPDEEDNAFLETLNTLPFAPPRHLLVTHTFTYRFKKS